MAHSEQNEAPASLFRVFERPGHPRVFEVSGHGICEELPGFPCGMTGELLEKLMGLAYAAGQASKEGSK